MKMIKGTDLHPDDQKLVLAAYVHRYTRNHVPRWAKGRGQRRCRCCNSIIRAKPARPVEFDSDQDWLKHTLFTVRKDGRLDGRVKACESHPTWPDNPELRGDGA